MKYLFIVPLPNSGGSILLNSLSSSQNISTLLSDPNNPSDLKKYSFPTGEGEYSIINNEYRANPYTFGRFPIKQYKRSVSQYWDKSKKIMCDKSPVFVKYAKELEQVFSRSGEVYFILLVRDPNHSRHIKHIDWETLAECQKVNQQRLKNACFVTYEEMCNNPESVRVKILQMLPELSDFQMSPKISKEFIKQKVLDQPKIRSEMSHYFGYTDKPIKLEKRTNKKEIREKVKREQREKRNKQSDKVLQKGQVLKPGQTLEASPIDSNGSNIEKPKPIPTQKPKIKVKKRNRNRNSNNKPNSKNNKYLFILCPPFSGSTILHKIINTHPNVSTFIGNPDTIEGQGQGFLIYDDENYESNRHNENYELPVERLKQLFDKHWNHDKPLLCDRSPPFVHFAHQIESYFEQFGDVYFICMIRNPYATRWIKESNWVRFAEEQKRNIETLKHVTHFTYEELVSDQEFVVEKLNDFLPEFTEGEFDFSVGDIEHFNKNDNRCKKISKRYLDRVDNADSKNEILQDNKHLLDFFGYNYIE